MLDSLMKEAKGWFLKETSSAYILFSLYLCPIASDFQNSPLIMGGRDKNVEDPMQSEQDMGGRGFLEFTLYMGHD